MVLNDYGGSGAPSSAFFSKWSGPATTLTAQSVISTAETMFESFLAGNYIYLNLTELLEWCETVLKNDKDMELDDFIQLRSKDELFDLLFKKILQPEENDSEIFNEYINSLDEREVTILFYKNNMIEFIDSHDYIKDIFIDIFSNVENMEYGSKNNDDWYINLPEDIKDKFKLSDVKEYNKYVDKTYFMDPNDPPKEIKYELGLLSDYLMKYCYVRYLSVDRIYRLRNFNRDVVTVIDTDSNFLSLDTLMNYIMDEIVGSNTFGRDREHNEFIAVNTITYTITNAIEDMLLYYGECSNIPEEERPRFNMKNEFYNSLLIIGKAKKRYISKQVLREGNLLSPNKSDIKGFDFKKATTSEYAENVFMDLINKYIINSDEINLKGLINGIKNFKDEIRESIKNGERTFLPNGNAKEIGAYKDPGSEQSIRGCLAWNYLYPDNQIEFPTKVSLLKMNIFNEKDMENLKNTHPDIYNRIMEKIFNDDTGIFVTKTLEPGIDYVNTNKKNWYEDIPKKYRTKYKKLGPVAWNEFVDTVDPNDPKYVDIATPHYEYKSRGLQVLAIPSNATIPEWTQPYIDFSTMINNIIAPFKPVLEIFGLQFVEEGKTRNGVNRKTDTITNIVKF